MKNRTHKIVKQKQKSHKSDFVLQSVLHLAYAKPVTKIYKMVLFTQLYLTSLYDAGLFFRFSHFAFFDVFSDQIGLFDLFDFMS